MLRILVVEDEAHNREALGELIKRLGHDATLVCDGKEALECVSRLQFDVILCDIRMPHLDGFQFFEAYKQLLKTGTEMPPFIFMTAYGRLEEAVDVIRKGAMHFLTKPLRKKDLVSILEEAQAIIKARHKYLYQMPKDIGDAVFISRAFGEVVQMVDKVAPVSASVLFIGESGTGKEILARRLHEKSEYQKGPFIPFHSGCGPESLIESELFGHEKGAFTGADQARMGQIRSAHGGTFFLDEITSMPLSVQTKLLRVIQDKQVLPLGATRSISCDVRWVCAANQPLEPLIAQGSFREDLLFRLGVVTIEIPPLRDRPEDIPFLTDYFMKMFSEREKKQPLKILEQTRKLLSSYFWPGNVRELRNVIERALVLAVGSELNADLLPAHIAQSQKAREIRIVVGSSLQKTQNQLIEETLRTCDGDKNKAASILGIAPRTLYRWMERQNKVLEKDKL